MIDGACSMNPLPDNRGMLSKSRADAAEGTENSVLELMEWLGLPEKAGHMSRVPACAGWS